ncbi:hypothetical protein Tco_1049911, partial [Tanacetum coccineum]
IWDNKDVHDLRSFETKFPAIVFNDASTSEATLSCEPTVNSLNDEIDFRVSFDDSDDEDYTIYSMAGEDENQDENANIPPPVPPTQQTPHTLSTIKLPILKKDTNGQIRVLPPKTAEEILARERERKARTTLLMFILEDHLENFHKIIDAKEMWEAIKSRFSGNDESKKMFQSLQSQLEIHGAGVSIEDANQKFLRSLHASWS